MTPKPLWRRVGLVALVTVAHACGGTALVGGQSPNDSNPAVVDASGDLPSVADTPSPSEVGADVVDVPSTFDGGAMDAGDDGGPMRVDAVVSEGVVAETGLPDVVLPLDVGVDVPVDVALDLGVDVGFDVPRDLGVDTGFDAGFDVGFDVPRDLGVDTGFDAGFDVGFDLGVDTGFDAGFDLGFDVGFDRGPEASVDTGFDGGADTGADVQRDVLSDTGTVPDDRGSDGAVDVVTGDGGAPVRCSGSPFPIEPRETPVPCRVTDLSCRPTRCSQIAGLTTSGPQTLYASDGSAPYRAWCVPESLGDSTGGTAWTLVLKVNGMDINWAYDNPRWTGDTSDVDQLPSNNPDLSPQSQRLVAYGRVPFHEVALAFTAPLSTRPAQSVRLEVAPSTEDQWRSLHDALRNCERAWTPTPISASAWTSALPGASLQPNCHRQGLNVSGNDPTYGRARIGILGDDSTSDACNMPDSRMGVGLQRTRVDQCASMNDNRVSAGVVTWCNPNGRGPVMETFTFVLVR